MDRLSRSRLLKAKGGPPLLRGVTGLVNRGLKLAKKGRRALKVKRGMDLWTNAKKAMQRRFKQIRQKGQGAPFNIYRGL